MIHTQNNNHFDESKDLTESDENDGRDDDDDNEDEEDDREFHGKISRDISNNFPRGDTLPSNISESSNDYVEGEDDDGDELSGTYHSVHSDTAPHGKRDRMHNDAVSASMSVINDMSPKQNGRPMTENESDDNDLITGDDDDEICAAAYGAKDHGSFKDASVSLSDEMKEVFQCISRYHPQKIDREPELQPFIPEYIPAIGDIDAFIKISRPDQKPESLGLTILDEPSGKQSDLTVLDLHLRAVTKSIAPVPQVVRSIDSVSLRTNPKPLDYWIRNVKELHAAKPAPSVQYSRRMPGIEDLMQVWPVEIEEALSI
ncbi:intraflagellar transport complex B protein 46 C terminal-domain-containing protein, partial [Chytriomyces sp. MP71]